VPCPLTVYKLGGSLLDLPDLGERLKAGFESAHEECPVLVVGGGAAADLVRDWDPRHRLGDSAAHQLAIAAMELNARLVRILLSRIGMAVGVDWQSSSEADVVVPDMLREIENPAEGPVPEESWEVTSDSLAAWLAGRCRARRLVFLKSAPWPEGTSSPRTILSAKDLQRVVEAGLCDSAVPRYLAAGVAAEWIDFRSWGPPAQTY
jgi:aspartokinase-like uncharacterized kinase